MTVIFLWMLFFSTPAGSMEQHPSPQTFHPIQQPLSRKLTVAAAGGSLIAAELLWFLKK